MFNTGLQNKTSVSEWLLIIELSKNNHQIIYIVLCSLEMTKQLNSLHVFV